jgi:hypothetical protein
MSRKQVGPLHSRRDYRRHDVFAPLFIVCGIPLSTAREAMISMCARAHQTLNKRTSVIDGSPRGRRRVVNGERRTMIAW